MLILAYLLIGIVAGIYTGLIGGAAGHITIPLLLLLGVPPHTAVSTPKLGALGIAIGSVAKFYRTDYIRWSLVLALTFTAAIAGVVGAKLLLHTPEAVLDKLVAVLLVVSVIALYSKKDLGVIAFSASTLKRGIGYVFYFISELFRAAFGSGFGLLTGIVLIYFFGLTMLESNATKRLPGVAVTLAALITFWLSGVINFQIGLPLFFGGIIGSYIGSHYAIKLGEKRLKILFTVVALIMAVALLVF